MNIPSDLKYAKTDEWIKFNQHTGIVGISDFAQDQLSDVVFVEITVGIGEKVTKGAVIGTIESVKAAADVNMPVSGKVLAVNESLPEKPELINSSPYDQAWLIKVEISDSAEITTLMDAETYEQYCEERHT